MLFITQSLYKKFINAYIIIKTLTQTDGAGKSHLHKDVNFRPVFKQIFAFLMQ